MPRAKKSATNSSSSGSLLGQRTRARPAISAVRSDSPTTTVAPSERACSIQPAGTVSSDAGGMMTKESADGPGRVVGPVLAGKRLADAQKVRMPGDGKGVEQPGRLLVRQIGGQIVQTVAGEQNDDFVGSSWGTEFMTVASPLRRAPSGLRTEFDGSWELFEGAQASEKRMLS